VRWSIREHGSEPTNRHVDELLDECADAIDRLDPSATDQR
jgi:hypothetical protein